MNRAELQQLADMRVDDAEHLLAATRWSAAYYIAGYALECALKSCVLRYVEQTGMIFRERKYLKELENCWTHELDRLVRLAGLEAELGLAVQSNERLRGNWGTAQSWSESSRYETKSQADAQGLYDAITNDPDGVLPWLRKYW